MVDCCDLYAMLMSANRRNIKNVGIYCFVKGEISRPTALSKAVSLQEGGKFVEAEIFAVDLKSIKAELISSGLIGESDRFLVNASASVYVDKSLVENDWYFFRGTLMMSSTSSRIPLVTLMNSRRVGNYWVSSKISASDFEITHFYGTRRQASVLEESINRGMIVHPADVNMFTRLYAELPDSFVASNAPILNVPKAEPPKVEVVKPSTPAVVASAEYTVVAGAEKPAMGIKTSSNRKESRTRIKDKPAIFNDMEDWLKDAAETQDNYISTLKEGYELSDDRKEVARLLNHVLANWKTRVGNAITGRMLIKAYMEKSGEDLEQDYMGESLLDYILDIRDEVFDFCLGADHVTAEGEALSIIKNLFGSPETVYAGIVSILFGFGYDNAVDMAKSLSSHGISFSRVFENNPYLLTICGYDMKFAVTENIAYAMGVWNKRDIQKSRNIAIVSDYMLYSDTQDTNYTVESIREATLGVRATKSVLDRLRNGQSILPVSCQRNINAYFPEKRQSPYPTYGWEYKDGAYFLALGTTEVGQAINDAVSVGMIIRKKVSGIDMLLCTTFLKMELFVLDKCYKLAQRTCRYNDLSRINALIDEYEKMKGFKLEQAQRQGVLTSVTNNISAISGPAGSGKTTTSDCLVYVYTHYFDSEDVEDEDKDGKSIKSFKEDDIQYAAPTGKAAKRLQEVVGRPVSTMHSKFKVGIGEKTVLDGEDNDFVTEGGAKVYIFDEVAMCTLKLLYTVLSRTSNATIVLLGDICQLSPIGKGLPFRDLLKFIPCTFLLVSKRSLEGSGLTLNSTIINDYSEPSNFKFLENSADFKLLPCSDDDIANKIYAVCGYHLGKITKNQAEGICHCDMIDIDRIHGIKPDDIQVVMPVSTDRYSWGASVVNARLQDLFNPKTLGVREFKIQNFDKEKVFRVGDRVIHTNSNMYTMQWYSSFSDKAFTKAWGSGIMNGDVGKIVDIIEAKKRLRFSDPVDPMPEGYEEPKHTIRKDKSWRGDDHYFVVVEYYDYGSGKNYYILYQAAADGYAKGDGLYLVGEDLSFLDLSYALTTHKMQGSQGKLIVYGLGKVRRQGFVTRNAVYTGETRASCGEYMIGSVDDVMTSQLNMARQIVEQEGVSTILGDIWDLQ